eukprot:TRINITY_DN7433_c0_g1_i1.p1 TRINITY_DN7433_c0_g1~~TRINITY_DN7433_c0_g1_i1.p1  ORF type:complete len:257 (-),score=27.17 TRINITY_DN7433_c0_g1_i1:168-938(-)
MLRTAFMVSRRCLSIATSKPVSITVGVDEAGRGALFGPMVIAAAAVSENAQEILRQLGVRDSKTLSPHKRELLAGAIKQLCIEWSSVVVSAQKIDEDRGKGINLNEIELTCMTQALRRLGCLSSPVTTVSTVHSSLSPPSLPSMKLPLLAEKIIVDSIDINCSRLQERLRTACAFSHAPAFVCEHRAERYMSVAAASILAKTERDRLMHEIEQKVGVPLGSGYPSDPTTKKAVAQFSAKLPREIVRRSWNSKVHFI